MRYENDGKLDLYLLVTEPTIGHYSRTEFVYALRSETSCARDFPWSRTVFPPAMLSSFGTSAW
jgi:hypothetical protein